MIRPSAPLRMIRIASCAAGKYGISLVQRTNADGRASAAATIRPAAARSMPKGFSAKRSFPASSVSR